LLKEHIVTTPEERLALALWILHTYVFDRYTITPRLALLSPVRRCGKTTLLSLLGLLVAAPYRADSVTAAAVYHQLDCRPKTTWLVDEGDNLDIFKNGVLRAVFNSGHRRGGSIGRFVGGWSRKFPTFSPLAVAAIGMLPLPLVDRSIVINMQRAPRHVQIKLLDEADPAFVLTRDAARQWAARCSLSPQPEMPASLRNRAADNWRVLLAIADALSHSDDARNAATALCSNQPDEDVGVLLLADIQIVFVTHGVDRLSSAVLVEALLGLEHAFWHEWRGPNDDRQPRKFTQGDLARMLRPFRIRPRTIWPKYRQAGGRSARGYLRSDFEPVWAAYCSGPDTPTHSSKIIRLPRP
jgi:hypothetical protein